MARSVVAKNRHLKWQARMLEKLTPREREVLMLYVKLPVAEAVATKLGTQPQTVRNQLASMLRKWNVESREEMIVRFLSK